MVFKRSLKRIIMVSFILIISLILLFIFDPPVERTVQFEKYQVSYEWRLFNNELCNRRTYAHCSDNKFNKNIAEIKLCKKLLEEYTGQDVIKNYLVEIVNDTYLFNMRYRDIVGSTVVNIDSLKRHGEQIFQEQYIE